MNSTIERIAVLGSILAALPLISSLSHAQVFKRALAADGVSSVKIEVAGATEEIAVQGWDGKQVEIECKGGELKIETTAGAVLIQTEVLKGCDSIAVKMPRNLKLKVNAVSGNVTAASLNNRVDVASVSGDVRVSGISGTTDVEVVSGDIHVRAVRGDLSCKAVSGDAIVTELTAERLEVKSVSGDISIGDSNAKDVRLSTHSGDINYSGVSSPQNELKVKSFSGDLRIALPASGGFDLSAETQSGSMDIEHKIQASERTEKTIFGIFQNGGPDVTMATFSGDISLKISSQGK